jgi:AcrR family transcriptional regulator
MIDAVAECGYAAATIAEVVTSAGVSRPTFYEYFVDKNDCFVSTLESIQEELLARVAAAIESGPPERSAYFAVGAVLDFAEIRAEMACVLVSEAMGAGTRALDVRDQGLNALGELIEARYEAIDSRIAPDLASRPLLGGIYRLLASRLRAHESFATAELRTELFEWIGRYMTPVSKHRWRQLQPTACPTAELIVEPPLAPHRRLGRASARISSKELLENYRQRILAAAADLAIHKGSSATTVTEVARGAGIDNRALYRLFKGGKEEIFLALYELLFRRVLAAAAAGFHAGSSWPEKIWEAARVFARYVQQHPALSRACFVDSFACEIAVVQRVDQLVDGFTLFLQEGFRYEPNDDPPSALALQAIAATLFEIGYLHVREDRIDELLGVVPHTTFVALAPFMGAEACNKFIDETLARPASPSMAS